MFLSVRGNAKRLRNCSPRIPGSCNGPHLTRANGSRSRGVNLPERACRGSRWHGHRNLAGLAGAIGENGSLPFSRCAGMARNSFQLVAWMKRKRNPGFSYAAHQPRISFPLHPGYEDYPCPGRAAAFALRCVRGTRYSSLALLNAKLVTRRVFSSRISVRVIGGSARWLQFSRSQSRQLTPIGVPSAFSRSMPVA